MVDEGRSQGHNNTDGSSWEIRL